jgi:phosphate-selective porin OprO/OprP
MRALVILALLTAIAHAGSGSGSGAGSSDLDDLPDLAPKDEPWNHVDLKVITVRFGAGFLFDWATYEQDTASKEALPLEAAEKVRDFRILLKGDFPWLPRATYMIGYMYDGPTATWRWRQSGLNVEFPELNGDVFLGRMKEPFSTNKMMTGYFGFTNERSAASDSFLPILADGARWTGRLFTNHIVYGAGCFFDQWSETEGFNKNDKQCAGRVVFLQNGAAKDKPVIHVAFAARFADSNDGFLRYRSKPESFPAQEYVVDTGKFAADHSETFGAEVYYRPGPLTFGTEYYVNRVKAPSVSDPIFHGGEALVAYLFTGEQHPYNPKNATFGMVSPARSLYSGWLGAFEGVLRVSYVDLDSGAITGGKFWRVTPMVNWYVSDNIRLEAVYGYGRFDIAGSNGWQSTQFIQTRVQLTLD